MGFKNFFNGYRLSLNGREEEVRNVAVAILMQCSKAGVL